MEKLGQGAGSASQLRGRQGVYLCICVCVRVCVCACVRAHTAVWCSHACYMRGCICVRAARTFDTQHKPMRQRTPGRVMFHDPLFLERFVRKRTSSADFWYSQFHARQVDLQRLLAATPPEVLRAMQTNLVTHAKEWQYSIDDDTGDALHVTLRGLRDASQNIGCMAGPGIN